MTKRSKTDMWMPIYIGDYLADTMRLTTLQHGAYFLLMLEYWRQGPLPDDADELSAIARTDRKTWDKSVWPGLKRFFHKHDDGCLHQKRADQERAFAAEKSSKRADAARSRWEQTESKQDANASANVCDLDEQTECKGHPTCASRPQASPSPSQLSSLQSDNEVGTQSAPSPPKEPRGHRISDDWEPDLDLRTFATGKGFTVEQTREIARTFHDFWRAESGARASKRDWNAAFRVWISREKPRQSLAPNPRHNGEHLPFDRMTAEQKRQAVWANVPDIEGV